MGWGGAVLSVSLSLSNKKIHNRQIMTNNSKYQKNNSYKSNCFTKPVKATNSFQIQQLTLLISYK